MQRDILRSLEFAENVFQVHAIDAGGAIVVRRKLRRSGLLSVFERLEPSLVVQVFGAAAKHARTTVGVAELPRAVTVEVDAVFEIRP